MWINPQVRGRDFKSRPATQDRSVIKVGWISIMLEIANFD